MTIAKYKKFTFIAILTFVIGIIFYLLVKKISITSYDYWWHMKAGEWIVNNGKIPTNDIFSWYGISNNLPWISHEWLAEVLMWCFASIYGINLGGWLLNLVCLIILFVILFLFNRRNYINNRFLTIIWICTGIGIMEFFINPRPYLISYILLAVTIYLCEELRKNENSKKIYLLPIVSLLWGNFHGGSSNLVYIIPICYLVPNLFDIKWYRLRTKKLTNKQIMKYATCLLLSLIALAINPHGINMLSYPYVNMLDSTMQENILEWRAIDLKQDLFFGLFIFAIMFVGMFTKKELKITDCILLFFFIFLSLRSVRFIAMLYIVASFIIFKYVKPIKLNKRNIFYDYMRNLPVFFMLLGVLFMGLSIYGYSQHNKEIVINKLVSDEVITKIKENGYEKIFNSYGLGGYLIFNDIKVFIDGRADMYSNNIFEEGININRVGIDVEEKFEKFDFDAFVINKTATIYYYLKSNDKYKLIIEDENVAVYEKKS